MCIVSYRHEDILVRGPTRDGLPFIFTPTIYLFSFFCVRDSLVSCDGMVPQNGGHFLISLFGVGSAWC